jgi:hypothetical protein
MAGTLASMAGAAFYDHDVVTRFRQPIAAETAVLDSYVFLPHARSGIAAALDVPFAWGAPARASVQMSVPVTDDRGALDAQMTVHVYGPGSVTELDTRQVIRTWPKADAHDSEITDLVQIEFDRPELPWLFTPTGPDHGRLVPWISLVVAEAGEVEWGPRRGTVQVASIRRNQLQPLRDAWAWAHAQVMGAKSPDPAAEPTLERRLSGQNAPFNLSRLVCPRRLAPNRAYVACVVPTFSAGQQAGLDLTPDNTLQPSWGTVAGNFDDGDPGQMVDLPVYYSWRFGTGDEGDFESLARKVKPAVAPPGVGRRRVDATHPWPDIQLAADDPGAEMVVEGPIVSPQDPQDSPEEQWPTPAQQAWDPGVTDELTVTLNRADEQAHVKNPGPPLVGPPLYASMHARQPRIETDAGAAAAQPEWFRELNLDPRDRVVGGLGTRVVQHDQEDLMASAWNQVVGVDEANRQLRLAQLAKQVGAALHRRHLKRFSDAAVLSATERVHAKVLDAPAVSVWASLDASTLPVATTTGAFRRLLRPRGPVMHAAVQAEMADGVVDALVVRPDRLTADWVLPYRQPDGIVGLSAAARERISQQIADRIAPGSSPAQAADLWAAQLAEPGVEQVLTADLIDRIDFTAERPEAELAAAAIARVLQSMPSERDLDEDPSRATAAAAGAFTLQRLVRAGLSRHVARYELVEELAGRLDLPVQGRGEHEQTVLVTAAGLNKWAERMLQVARRADDSLRFDDLAADASELQERLLEVMHRSAEDLPVGLKLVAERLVRSDGYGDIDRARIDVSALDLVAKLNPAVTIPHRVSARLTGGTGRFPSWLRPDWFDDLRIEPVMACPRFAYPMYEALDRYDRNWLIPGLGLIKKPDMATLLETNSRFVEAFLVGLNHEMARELLWREYPTDQRGTYFSSFWTGAPELVADLHELSWRNGGLGSHVDPALDGQIVFLVRGDVIRRYPGVVAHAVRQAQDAGGLKFDDQRIPLFEPGSETSPKKTLFHIHLAPNMLLVGFALTEAEIRNAAATWWFTLSENPTEPRFGLDASRQNSPPPGPPPSRDDLVWDDFAVAEGAFLDASAARPIQFTDVATGEASAWGVSSAQVAALLFQLPARAAFQATKMLDGAVHH